MNLKLPIQRNIWSAPVKVVDKILWPVKTHSRVSVSIKFLSCIGVDYVVTTGISVKSEPKYDSDLAIISWSDESNVCGTNNDSCWLSETAADQPIFIKPQQWPTPSEFIAIYCVRKLVSCVTHLKSCAIVDIWNKRKKLHTVAKIKTQDYKNWRLQNLSTIVTPLLNTATILFNEHRSQRPFVGTSDWQNIPSAFVVVRIFAIILETETLLSWSRALKIIFIIA